jgi:SAM-dependent methyltransferase
MTQAFSGFGPGMQTPDGCSVELYRRLPYMGELGDIENELRAHATALELGCGTGRLCARMQALGLRVTGVDESAEMLAHLPPGVEGIDASIETLQLNRRWPAVLLPSHLINHPDEAVRRSFVEASKRHISPAGRFYVKRHAPGWLVTVQPGPIGNSHGFAVQVEHVSRKGAMVTVTIRYETYGQCWTQSFTACALEEQEIESLLQSCGFGSFEWFGAQRLWVAASVDDE